MGALTWREVSRVPWQSPRPPAPNGSTGPGTDYGVTVKEQATWPQDGSTFAGRTYEQCWVWQGPSPDFRQAVIISHSQYPAPEPAGECPICVPGQCPGADCPAR